MHPCIQNNDFEIGKRGSGKCKAGFSAGHFESPLCEFARMAHRLFLSCNFHASRVSGWTITLWRPALLDSLLILLFLDWGWILSFYLVQRKERKMLYVLHVYNFVPNERRMINFQGILKYRFDDFSLLHLEIYKWRWYIRILLVSISICWFILWRCSFHWFILLSIFYSSFSSIYCHDF